MEKRYQVFVSSTYEDLREERAAVIQSLLESDCIPAGMELFPASDDTQWDLIKRVIDDCDYYLVIIGGRYGSIGKDGTGYTEMEYDYAVSQKKPVAGFVHARPESLVAGRCEATDAGKKLLGKFREKVQGRMVKRWSSADDLAGKVAISLNQLKKTNPGEGWVKARFASDPESIVKLREKIDVLQAELHSLKTSAPADAAELAQGEDKCEIDLQLAWTDFGVPSSILSVDPTWDEVFSTVGPLMFHEASEFELVTALTTYLINHFVDNDDRKSIRFSKSSIHSDSFHTIIIQLRALGLIEKSDRKRGVHAKGNFWRLTPFGENYVTRLKAVRRRTKKKRQ